LPDSLSVRIVVGHNPEECEANCGTDWRAAESIAFATGRIKEKFGENISLECIDLTENNTGDTAKEWTEIIKNKNLSLPLLVVNGQVRISGQFDVRQMINVIDIERELGGL